MTVKPLIHTNVDWRNNWTFFSNNRQYLLASPAGLEPVRQKYIAIQKPTALPTELSEHHANPCLQKNGFHVYSAALKRLHIVHTLYIIYERDSICNEIALITPPTHGLELYTIYGMKDKCLTFQMVYETLFYRSNLSSYRRLKRYTTYIRYIYFHPD